MLDLFAQDLAHGISVAAETPWREEATAGGNFDAAWNEGWHFNNSQAQHQSLVDIVGQEQEHFFNTTNWRVLGVPTKDEPRPKDDYDAFALTVKRYNDQNPDKPYPMPTREQMQQRADALSLSSRLERQQQEALPQTFTSRVGGLAGDLAGAAVDPINAAAMAVGAPAATTILRAALIEGGLGGLSQGAIELGTYDFKHRIDPEFGVKEALGNVAFAAGGAAVISGGLRGLAKAYGLFRDRGSPMSRATLDAGNVIEREAATMEGNPFEAAGPQGEALHRSGIEAASSALERDLPVTLPPEVTAAVHDPDIFPPERVLGGVPGITDPKLYTGPKTPAVQIGGEIFTGASHADALEKAIERFGIDSPEIKAFDDDPMPGIGLLYPNNHKGILQGFAGHISGDDAKGERELIAEKLAASKSDIFPGDLPSRDVGGPAVGTTRFYHGWKPGGEPTSGGGRWLTQDIEYARKWNSHGEDNRVSFVDIPNDSPLLTKAWEDAGTDQKAPFVQFEAPEGIAKELRPIETTPAARLPKSPPGGKPVPLIDFIASIGGVKRDIISEPHDLGGIFVPGKGKLLRKEGGLSLDQLREAVIEAGYPIGKGGTADDRMASSTVDDLLEAVHQDLRARGKGGTGARVTRIEDQGHADDLLSRAKSERGQEKIDEFANHAQSDGYDTSNRALVERAAEHYHSGEYGYDPGAALERAAMELESEHAPAVAEHSREAIPGWDDATVSRDASSGGAEVPADGGNRSDTGGPGQGTGVRADAGDAGIGGGAPSAEANFSRDLPGDLTARAGEATSPEAAEAALTDPLVDDAAIQYAYRLIEGGHAQRAAPSTAVGRPVEAPNIDYEALYEGMRFGQLKARVENPLLKKILRAYEDGLIYSPDDIREMVRNGGRMPANRAEAQAGYSVEGVLPDRKDLLGKGYTLAQLADMTPAMVKDSRDALRVLEKEPSYSGPSHDFMADLQRADSPRRMKDIAADVASGRVVIPKERAAMTVDPVKLDEATAGLSTWAKDVESAAIPQARSDLTVPVTETDAAGNEIIVERNVADLFDELDQEIAAADELKACATGAMEPAQ